MQLVEIDEMLIYVTKGGAVKGGATGDKDIQVNYHLNYDLVCNLSDCVGGNKFPLKIWLVRHNNSAS